MFSNGHNLLHIQALRRLHKRLKRNLVPQRQSQLKYVSLFLLDSIDPFSNINLFLVFFSRIFLPIQAAAPPAAAPESAPASATASAAAPPGPPAGAPMPGAAQVC